MVQGCLPDLDPEIKELVGRSDRAVSPVPAPNRTPPKQSGLEVLRLALKRIDDWWGYLIGR
jgi:hypothetical protein